MAIVATLGFTGDADGGTSGAIDTTGATLLAVWMASYHGAISVPVLTDSKSNTWTQLTRQFMVDPDGVWYYAANPTVGTGHTFTITSSSGFAAICVVALSDIVTTSPFDVENGNEVTAGTSIDLGTVTPNQNNSVILAGLCWNLAGQVPTIGDGFTVTDRVAYASGNNMGAAAGYLIQTTAAAVDPTWSWTDATNAVGTTATFKPATGPAQKKITQLAALTDPVLTDIMTAVDDVAGTPLNKKFTVGEFIETFGVLSNVVVQVKSVGSGTYTPTTGMKKVLAIGVGGGGAGAGGINTDSAGGGGGGGGAVIRLLTAAQIGANKSYFVGAAGAATTLDGGTLLNAGGGSAGTAGATFSVLGVSVAGGAGGSASNGDLNIPGQPGQRGVIFSATIGRGGKGGSSLLGAGGAPGGTDVAGGDGTNYGGGGAGGHAAAATDRAGGAGAPGILYLIEWIS